MSRKSNVAVMQVSLLEWLGHRPSSGTASSPVDTSTVQQHPARTFSVAEREEALARAQRRYFAQDLDFRTR